MKTGSTHCQVCGSPTGHDKPFCSEHVLRHPYASAVREEVRARELGEVTEALVEDALVVLEQRSSVTVRRLAKELGLGRDHAERLAAVLCERGLLSGRWVSPRGFSGISAA